MRIYAIAFIMSAAFVVQAATAAEVDLLRDTSDAPTYELSNFRAEVDQFGSQVLRFDFKRTREGTNTQSISVHGKSKQGLLTVAAHVPSFTKSGTMELTSLFPSLGQRQVDIEVFLVQSHDWGDAKTRYVVVSNSVRLGDPGPPIEPRNWTHEEEEAYENYNRVMADDSAQKPRKSYPVGIDTPEDWQFVPEDAKVVRGTPLQACYSNKWHPLTVLSENPDGSINVRWDAYGAKFDCSMVRSELIINNASLLKSSADGSLITLPRDELEKRGLVESPAKPLKSYPVSIDVPNHSAVVPANLKLKPGTKLMACYAGKWNPITTLSENKDGTVNVRWDDYGPAYDCSMSREELIVRKSVVQQLQKTSDEPAKAELRTWTDSTGKFTIKARLVRKSDTSVTLETESGREVMLPISKLSEADQKLLK